MTRAEINETENDIFPRDQLEYYKLEVTRLRTENERLSSEVGFLRQALAATFTKIPQLNKPTTSTDVVSTTPEAFGEKSHWLWQHATVVPLYVRYFSLVSLMASPVVLFVILILGLICTLLFVASIWLLPNGLL